MKNFIPLTYVITCASNSDFISFIHRSTSLTLVCICSVPYLQLAFNLQLKNEHICGVGVTRWWLSMFFMGVFHLFHIFSICVWKISFLINSKVLLSFFEEEKSGRLILNKESWKWVIVKRNIFSNNLCFLL